MLAAMKRHLGLFLACALLMQSAPGHSADRQPIILQPSSNWIVDFDEEKCRLSRIFGEGENSHVLFFEQWSPSSNFGLVAAGPSFERYSKKRKIEVQFGALEKMDAQPTFFGELGEVGRTLIYSHLTQQALRIEDPNSQQTRPQEIPNLDLKAASKVFSLSFWRAKTEVRFNTGNLAEPFAVMNQCTRNLFESWGLDVARHRAGRTPPVWLNEMKIVRSMQQDYPVEALRKGEQTTKFLRVIVDVGGNVIGCKLEDSTATESFNTPVCETMKGAKFKPALDVDGKPMKSYYITSITYRLGIR